MTHPQQPEPCAPHQRLYVLSGHIWLKPCPTCGFCSVCCQSGPRKPTRIVTGYEPFCAACGRLVTEEARRAADAGFGASA